MGDLGQLLHALASQEILVIATEIKQRAIRAHFDNPVRQPAHKLTVVLQFSP